MNNEDKKHDSTVVTTTRTTTRSINGTMNGTNNTTNNSTTNNTTTTNIENNEIENKISNDNNTCTTNNSTPTTVASSLSTQITENITMSKTSNDNTNNNNNNNSNNNNSSNNKDTSFDCTIDNIVIPETKLLVQQQQQCDTKNSTSRINNNNKDDFGDHDIDNDKKSNNNYRNSSKRIDSDECNDDTQTSSQEQQQQQQQHHDSYNKIFENTTTTRDEGNTYTSSRRRSSSSCQSVTVSKVNSSTSSSTSSSIVYYCILVIVHIIVICIYAIPMFIQSKYNTHGIHTSTPVLDELHILSDNNKDINGIFPVTNTTNTSTIQSMISIWSTVFTNDYWGRPINSASSHKSWRPLSVLLFRYVRGLDLQKLLFLLSTTTTNYNMILKWFHTFFSSDLNVYRLINILTHATIAELVSQLGIKLICIVPSSSSSISNTVTKDNTNSNIVLLFRCIIKLVFALHPTHVEVTANVANRPHLLALVCTLLLCDIDTPIILFIISLVCGFLFCETFIFQIIPAIISICIIQYIGLFHNVTTANAATKQQQIQYHKKSILQQIIIDTILYQSKVLVRIILLVCTTCIYYYGRYYYNTLSIPTGLIRPAENPFFTFIGYERYINYSYILSIHIAKQWDWDFIGFSHEYGYECIQSIKMNDSDHHDFRILIPIAILYIHCMILLYFLVRNNRSMADSSITIVRNASNRRAELTTTTTNVLSRGFLLYIFHLSWSFTLFPVAGIIKVGTFIADRLVVASTVSVSIMYSYSIVVWIISTNRRTRPVRYYSKVITVIIVLLLMWKRIYIRSCQWMDSLTLLESSLVTCPRFAKGHLEISKIYSGLYKDKYNLQQSLWHLQQVEKIDPSYCDVHQQFAHVAIQQYNYPIFEERLYNALLCPYTMGGSYDLYQRYWTMILSAENIKNDPKAQQRYQYYQTKLQQAIADSEKNDNNHSTDSSTTGTGTKSNKQLKSPLVGWD